MITAGATLSVADERPDAVGGQVLIPDASIEHLDHIGRVAHTNTKIFVPIGGMDSVHPHQAEAAVRSRPARRIFTKRRHHLAAFIG